MSRSMPTPWSARSTAAGRRLSRALNAGRAGAAAELVGVAAGASEMTFEYLKQRKQFGKLIGEFQVLQHRAAHLYGEIEIARAAALKAAQLLDAGDDQAELFVSVAKAKAGRVSALAVQEGVQMHGGIGMTDEHDIGLYMKRDAVLGELFGSPALSCGAGREAQRLLGPVQQEIDPAPRRSACRARPARRTPRHWPSACRAVRSAPRHKCPAGVPPRM